MRVIDRIISINFSDLSLYVYIYIEREREKNNIRPST